MRRRRSGGPQESEVDMTPMLDIVFIMLIFFIVTATFLDETGLDVTRPQQSNDDSENNAPSVLVQVDARGFVTVNLRAVSPEAVASSVSRELARFPGAAVIYRTHPESLTDVGVEVYDQIKQSGAPVTWERTPGT